MLPEITPARYDAGHDPRLAAALVNSREAASISAIYREIRAAIYAGEYAPGAQLPTRAQFAERKRVSAESITIVMRMLATEGLVSSEQGRGTFVLPRRRFRTGAAIPRTGDSAVAEDEVTALRAALDAAVADEPATSALSVRFRHGLPGETVPALIVTMTAETGGPETTALTSAVAVTLATVRAALRDVRGWDLAGTSVTDARPAGGDQG